MTATYAVDVRVEQPWRLAGPGVMSVGGLVAITASFADWLRTGSVDRSSYEILGLIDRLGFAPDGPVHTLVRAWPLMPLLITGAIVAAWWGRHFVGASLGVLGGLYAGALGVAVAGASPQRRLISVSVAPAITAAGAAVLILGSLLAVCVRVPSAHAHPR